MFENKKFEAEVLAGLDAIRRLILAQGERIMSSLTDLQGAVTSVQADVATLLANQQQEETQLVAVGSAVSTAVTLIQNLQSGTVNADDPQVEAAAQALAAADATLQAMQTSAAADTTTLSGIATSLSAVAPAPPAPASAKKPGR